MLQGELSVDPAKPLIVSRINETEPSFGQMSTKIPTFNGGYFCAPDESRTTADNDSPFMAFPQKPSFHYVEKDRWG